ncbi:SDR family NAD(P)-dependent oxidoreductase [Actinocrinis sp.]|uniref:SDR family NAD(P)-dependent oxidoreductase n=1 Tax=Actinocrinis sp. TaxID=1920516 RepID=UPI002CB39922|nr:SDR family NAD(P)-dependent oxidoreductase [Actinocrinis sp.]HXR72567.1 SDR family NAD(P)-dependent oxidoreductase [Actinocrinis sp.]
MTVALVTGANQGVGFAVARQLVQALGPSATVYLTGRDPERVERAAAEAPGTVPAVMDVRQDDAVAKLAAELADRHGAVDVVVSNAAARRAPGRADAETVRAFVDTNNLGTTRMIRSFGPILRPGGRFLVVASAFGSLRNLDPKLRPLFDTEALTLDEVDRRMLEFADLVEAGRHRQEGWPESINIPSKIGQVAAARVFAREQARRDGVHILAVCPGLVDTDASRPWFADMSQAQSPDEAARDLVRLARGDVEPEFYGRLVQHRHIIPWT